MPTTFLFSSNIRPQYEQDIVDVAAAAPGTIVRFRYEQKYIATDLRQPWSDNQAVGQQVVVVYSIQQPADYHPAAYVPIRRGKINRTSEDGSVFVVEFTVGPYVTLNRADDETSAGQRVRAFSAALNNLSGHPGHDDEGLRFSAASGPEPTALLAAGDTEAVAFERLVEFLTDTVSFAGHAFWRVTGIRKLGTETDIAADAHGRFRLYSDATYELTIGHWQKRLPPGTESSLMTFDVATDTGLAEIVGAKQFAIGSRYDSVPIRLRIPVLDEAKETVLTIRPGSGARGPNADVRLLVGPSEGRRAATAVLGAATALALVVPDLAGDEAPVLVRFVPHVLAAAFVAYLGYRAVPNRGK